MDCSSCRSAAGKDIRVGGMSSHVDVSRWFNRVGALHQHRDQLNQQHAEPDSSDPRQSFRRGRDDAFPEQTRRRCSRQRTRQRAGRHSRSVRNGGRSDRWVGRSVPADRHLVNDLKVCSDPGARVIQLTMGPSMGSHGFTPALVAQRIRASDYGSEGREFESLQARFQLPLEAVFFWLLCRPVEVISYDQQRIH